MSTPIKSLFDVLPAAYQLPPEPLPDRIVKRFSIDGKIKEIVVNRKVKK